MVEHFRGADGFVSGKASDEAAATAEAAGFRTLSGYEGVSKELSDGIRNAGADPARFTLDFGETDQLYLCGPSPGWDFAEVFYRKSDRRFTARLRRTTDKGR